MKTAKDGYLAVQLLLLGTGLKKQAFDQLVVEKAVEEASWTLADSPGCDSATGARQQDEYHQGKAGCMNHFFS